MPMGFASAAEQQLRNELLGAALDAWEAADGAFRDDELRAATVGLSEYVRTMEPTVHFITLGVPDVDAARRFYVDGLGWQPLFEVPGEVIFIQVGHGLVLSLFGAADLAADSGGAALAAGAASAVTLAHNVATEGDVTAALAAAERAGGTILKPAQHAEWGGFHGYFADPAGFRWEVAMNPGWSVAPDGTVRIGPVDAA